MKNIERDNTIDVLKGIGILLIIAGHINFEPVGGSIISYLYTFNVAIFFFVAGLLWKKKKVDDFGIFIFSKFKSILIPYIVFVLISLAYGHIVVRLMGEYVVPFDLSDTLKALIFSSEWLNSVPTFNFALWFLPIFFIANICFYFLQLVEIKTIYLSIIATLFLVSLPFQELVPGRPILSINVLPVALVLMGLGYIWANWFKSPNISYIFIFIFVCFSIWLTIEQPGNIANIDSYWFYLSALLSILIYQKLAIDLKESRILLFLGANSLIVYGLHGIVSNIYRFTGIPQYLEQNWSGLALWMVNLVFVVVVTSAITVTYLQLKRIIFARKMNSIVFEK